MNHENLSSQLSKLTAAIKFTLITPYLWFPSDKTSYSWRRWPSDKNNCNKIIRLTSMSMHLQNALMTDLFTKILSELDWSLTHLIIPGGGPPIIGLGAPIGGIPTIKYVIYYNMHTTIGRPYFPLMDMEGWFNALSFSFSP